MKKENTIIQGGLENQTDWFCWDWPVVSRRVIRGTDTQILTQKYIAPLRKTTPSSEWSVIHPPGFDAVYWTFSDYPALMCNGLKIDIFHPFVPKLKVFNWPEYLHLDCPKIAIVDSGAKLPLTIQRYALSDKNLPFINELSRDVTFSFIAHALICGPTARNEAYNQGQLLHPLVIDEYGFDDSLLRWCSSLHAMVPVDPWLYSLLEAETCILFRVIGFDDFPCGNLQHAYAYFQAEHQAILPWNSKTDRSSSQPPYEEPIDFLKELIGYFSKHANNGFQVLGQNNIDIKILVSLPKALRQEAVIKSFETNNGRNVEFPNSQRLYFSFQSEMIVDPISLNHLKESMDIYYTDQENLNDLLYIAEIKTKPSTPAPETLLAIIWEECLGAQPIPFDPEARRALIEHGRQHPELKRHIEAWEEMSAPARNG